MRVHAPSIIACTLPETFSCLSLSVSKSNTFSTGNEQVHLRSLLRRADRVLQMKTNMHAQPREKYFFWREKFWREKYFFWMFAYSACSSTMLVVNKLTVDSIPVPALVSAAQLTSCAAFVLVLHCARITNLSAIGTSGALSFLLYTAIFSCSLFANMKALLLTNVGAVIAARCCLPAIVCVIEWAFMDRTLPTMRSLVSLSGVIGFGALYARLSSGFVVSGSLGYIWLFTWWIFLALSMTFGRWLTEKVEMTQWGRVFYNNCFALPPTGFLFVATGEYASIQNLTLGMSEYSLLLVSCIVGVGISYSSWRLRSTITAASFTLVGVLNKMVTTFLTAVIWPRSSSMEGNAALIICIAFGLLYEGAAKRPQPTK